MRFERLAVEAGSHTLALTLHPRFTVVCGLARPVREALTGELIASLGPGRPGLHVEVVEDGGRRLAVFRPPAGPPKAVDLATTEDVTNEFSTPEGKVDLLAAHGVEHRVARRLMRFSASDLGTASRSEAIIRRLADVDQTELWSTAARVRVTDEELQRLCDQLGTAPQDAELIDRIEQRHQELERAVAQLAGTRTRTFLIGGLAGLAGVVLSVFGAPSIGLPLVGIAIVAAVAALVYRRRVEQAAKAEDEVLSEAGADSYVAFQLRRVDGLVSNDQQRRRLLQVAADHREAAAAWAALVDDVGVEWALEHHDQIVTSARLRQDVHSVGAATSTVSDPEIATTMAHTVVARLAELRSLGRDGEGFPLVLEEPLLAVEPDTKPALLEMLVRTSTSSQVILLTDDEAVASWARLEALTGTLSVLEPTPAPSQ